ncbi:hypothetical protein PRIPAC_77305 [Pristionchus pacificus]|uniref:Uncharacterized protein n=1 Tax=Pristionchus pacificus TaxID=54126 RepID=A0A2A6C314_PRIPA|nr:hypothetical protein PRIPAC_77305 [Pristionchus pacificus]|eukprot:PDM72509.1 hypothetical protein PRIPAC_38943 [Pristionchus pacificus]
MHRTERNGDPLIRLINPSLYRMHLTLAVICLATAALAQEFIPIGGGSGRTAPVRVSQEFGESFTPSIIDPNDPSFQPANIAGNRPNPIPLFPKTQQAGTPHESPVDFTFVHQHSYKEPFRNDQFIGILHNPIGAARPNVPRTLGRENIYIDPRTIPNSAVLQAEAEKKNKAMMFYGLAAPIQKLHSADEFAPSSVQFQKPWDQWYDRFTEAPVLPRRQSSLTQTKRPNMVDIPFYAADRGKRQAETSTEASTGATDATTTTVPSTTTILSDAIGSSTAVAALETTTTAAAAVIGTTTGVEAELTVSYGMNREHSERTSTTTTTTSAPAAESTTATAAMTTVASTATTNSTSASPVSSTTTAPTATAKPLNQIAHDAPKIAASMDVVRIQTSTAHSLMNVTSNTPFPSTGPVIPFRVRNRRPHNSKKPVTLSQKLRSHRTKVPLRSTLIAHNTTHAPTTKRTLVNRKLDSAVGAAKNSSRAATTKLPIRNTTIQRRIFSKRPVAAAKLPARTPIQEEPKPTAIESNNIGTLRTEVNRLLSTVIQLQSTVISQQQRIALLENQLRLRRSAGKKPASSRKTSRFIAVNGRTVERTTVDVRKERSAKLKGGLSEVNLRQKSSLA